MPSLPPAEAKTAARTRWRKLRRDQPAQHRAAASRQICNRVLEHPAFHRAVHIAAYLALKDEVDLDPLLAQAPDLNKQFWLPRVAGGRMTFAAFDPARRQDLKRSSVGTCQPGPEAAVRPADRLDLVLLPLLAFTRCGDRLGMGGGYYDRTFSFMLPARPGAGPVLVGVAFAEQEAEQLHRDSWDVPLHHVVTQQEWIDCI